MAKIEINKQKQLAALNQKFSTADSAKTSLGYIAFISLGILFGSILLNDFFNLVTYCFPKLLLRDKRNDLEQNKQNESTEVEAIELKYSDNLEKRLEHVHLDLLRVILSRKLNVHQDLIDF